MSEERLEQLEAEVAALKALIEGVGIVVLDEGVIAGHGRYRRIDFLNASITDRGDRIEVNVTGGASANHAPASAPHPAVPKLMSVNPAPPRRATTAPPVNSIKRKGPPVECRRPHDRDDY